MTPEDFRDKVAKAISEDATHDNDCEALHEITDMLMEDRLIELGYGEAVELIRNTNRWYA